MAMCAGVQKVSRPIDRCQDTSHWPPMEAEVTASAPAQIYHGTELVRVATRVLVVVASATKPAEGARSADIDIPQELPLMIRETLRRVPESNASLLGSPSTSKGGLARNDGRRSDLSGRHQSHRMCMHASVSWVRT